MKKIIYTTLLVGLSCQMFSQNWAVDVYRIGTLYPGYIVKSTGEKVEGYIEAQSRGEKQELSNSNQTRVIFYTDKENKKSKVIYKPDDVKEYMIADKYYKSMNYSGGLTSKPLRFVLRAKEGCISTYIWYNCKQYNALRDECEWVETHLFQKGDDKPVDQSAIALGFAKKMSEYVSDYSDLSQKIQNKEKGYGVGKIYDVVDEYNVWCKTK